MGEGARELAQRREKVSAGVPHQRKLLKRIYSSECPVEVEEDDEVMAAAMLHSECRAKLCQRLMAYGPP